MKKVVGLVPVKANSERVKAKNLRPFGQTSLFELKLDQLSQVKIFEDIVVSSEDDGVLARASAKGFTTHKRDPALSTSNVPMSKVYSAIANEIGGEHIAWVNVTNPLATEDLYTDAIRIYDSLGDEFDCLLSVFELKEYVFYQNEPLNFSRAPWARSQDLQGMLAMSFAINILRRNDMVEWGSTVGNRPYLYICDRINSLDVDYQVDFDFCEHIYNQRS